MRRLLHDPDRILGAYVRADMRVADIGCGMGFFTVALARLVGSAGQVQAVDVQAQQLARVQARCERAGLIDRVELTRAEPDSLGLRESLNFVLAFWMVHEVPDPRRFLEEIRSALVPGGALLIAEPYVHVSRKRFTATLGLAEALEFEVTPVAGVRFSRAALLSR
jgi:ubiquinone/menaquinone biosynthesis C-methylase UbiE